MIARIEDDRLDRLITAIEQEILTAPDKDVLAEPAARDAAQDARAAVGRALAQRRKRAARPPGRQDPFARREDRRDLARQLLVASPRARAAAGVARLDGLSDADVEAILVRLAALGMLPSDRD